MALLDPRMDRVYTLLRETGPEMHDTFDNLSADYDFRSYEDVENILRLMPGESYSDGFANQCRDCTAAEEG